jgi:hypothetical protein
VRAWQVTAKDELELSSRDADEPPSVAELSAVAELLTVAELPIESDPLPPLLSEEFSSMSGPLTLALLLSSQAASVKVSAAAASPQAIFVRCFMVFLLLRVFSICS